MSMRDYCRICLLQFDKRPKAGVAGKYEGHADRPAAREHKTRKQTKKQTIEGTTKQTKKTNTNTHTQYCSLDSTVITRMKQLRN